MLGVLFQYPMLYNVCLVSSVKREPNWQPSRQDCNLAIQRLPDLILQTEKTIILCEPFNSQHLILYSPLYLLHISLLISCENLV